MRVISYSLVFIKKYIPESIVYFVLFYLNCVFSFKFKQQELLAKLKREHTEKTLYHDEEIDFHETSIKRHQEAIERHKVLKSQHEAAYRQQEEIEKEEIKNTRNGKNGK